jgi:hypothetical protein
VAAKEGATENVSVAAAAAAVANFKTLIADFPSLCFQTKTDGTFVEHAFRGRSIDFACQGNDPITPG